MPQFLAGAVTTSLLKRGFSFFTMTLDEIAIKHGTDKSSLHHDYCRIYEQYFEPLREKPISILELGYGGHEDPNAGGESAKMWREYFPDATVFVLDNEVKFNVPGGIRFIHASQDDVKMPYYIFSDRPNPQIIIDDASHLSSLTIKSFEILFPHLVSGGYYCIEDTHSSYHDFWYGKNEANENPKLNGKKTITTLNYLKNLTDSVNNDLLKEQYRLPYDIDSITFFKDLVIIKKK